MKLSINLKENDLFINSTFSLIVHPFSLISGSIAIDHDTISTQFSSHKLASVLIPRRSPATEAMSLDLTILELAFIEAAVHHKQLAMTWQQQKHMHRNLYNITV